jgi:hypothetical protein
VIVATTTPAAAAGRTPVWIGSPIVATWPNAAGCSGVRYPSADCSLPFAHHTFHYGNPYRGDFGIDQQNVSTPEIVLYAAPRDPNLGSQIRAKVDGIGLACAVRAGETYEATRRRGGNYLKIGIYHGTTRVGTVTYVHVNPAVSVGQWVNRWGSHIANVGSYTSNSCWTGRHLHLELYNDVNYACYNRSWRPGQQMYRSNFVGYLGGSFVSGAQQGCP